MWHCKARFILLGLLFWSVIPGAYASCSWNGQIGPTLFSAINSSLTINSLNSSVGSRLSDIGGVSGTPSWQTQCSGNESAGYTNQAGVITPAIANSEKGPIYNINALPGIGYSLSDTSLYNNGPNYFKPYGTVTAPGGSFSFDATAKLRIDFWRTGDLITGQYCLPAGTAMGYVRFDALTVTRLVMSNGLCVNVVGPTCTISSSSKNIAVPLGDQHVSQFTQIGSSTPSKGFNINLLACSNVKAVLLQFNATADSDYPSAAQQGVIQLQATANQAAGIGVQLLKGDGVTPMPLNSQQSVWQGASTSAITLPFSVRYLQTRTRVTPGQANALAQFVVAYQ